MLVGKNLEDDCLGIKGEGVLKEQDFIKVLQLYRHDLMNHLQMIHGYISINQQEKANEKISEMMHHFNNERKLFETNAPKFILWMLQVNHIEENIRVKYSFTADHMNFMLIEDPLIKQSQQIVNCIQSSGDPFELYELVFNFSENASQIKVAIHINGQLDKDEFTKCLNLMQMDNPIHIEQVEKGLNCMMTYFLHK